MRLSTLFAGNKQVYGAVVTTTDGAVVETYGDMDAESVAGTMAGVVRHLTEAGDAVCVGVPRVVFVQARGGSHLSMMRGNLIASAHYDHTVPRDQIVKHLSNYSWEVGERSKATASPVVAPTTEEAPRDDSLRVFDALSEREIEVYRSDEGRYLTYRVGVLGFGGAADRFSAQLEAVLAERVDLLDKGQNLRAKYRVALLQGQTKSMIKRLAVLQPNLLVLVNAGSVKASFADVDPQQLVFISRDINKGATVGGQRPYALVWAVDRPVPEPVIREYARLCEMMSVVPVSAQFHPDHLDEIAEFASAHFRDHAKKHFRIENR